MVLRAVAEIAVAFRGRGAVIAIPTSFFGETSCRSRDRVLARERARPAKPLLLDLLGCACLS